MACKVRVFPLPSWHARGNDALTAKQLSTDPHGENAPAPPRHRRRLLPWPPGRAAEVEGGRGRLIHASAPPIHLTGHPGGHIVPRHRRMRHGARPTAGMPPVTLRGHTLHIEPVSTRRRGPGLRAATIPASPAPSYLPNACHQRAAVGIRRNQRRMDRLARRHPPAPRRRRRRDHRRPRLPRRGACDGSRGRRGRRARHDRARHDHAGHHLPVDRLPAPAPPGRQRLRRVRRQRGLLGLRLRAVGRRQVHRLGCREDHPRGRRRNADPHGRLERTHHLCAVLRGAGAVVLKADTDNRSSAPTCTPTAARELREPVRRSAASRKRRTGLRSNGRSDVFKSR